MRKHRGMSWGNFSPMESYFAAEDAEIYSRREAEKRQASFDQGVLSERERVVKLIDDYLELIAHSTPTGATQALLGIKGKVKNG